MRIAQLTAIGILLVSSTAFLIGVPAAAKPKLVVTLVATSFDLYRTGSMVGINIFAILPDGTHVAGNCTTVGPEICTIEPFEAERRKSFSCFSKTPRVDGICYVREAYYADRKGNSLAIYSGSGKAIFHITGSWDAFEAGALPSPPNWTAVCNDDSISYSKERSGTCSDHGGVKLWRQPKE